MSVLVSSKPRYGLGGNKSQPRNFATRQKLVNENYKPLTDRGESNFSEPQSAQREASFKVTDENLAASQAIGFLQALSYIEAKKRSKVR